MEMPRAWTENAIKRRIGLALLVGFLLKAIAYDFQVFPLTPIKSFLARFSVIKGVILTARQYKLLLKLKLW